MFQTTQTFQNPLREFAATAPSPTERARFSADVAQSKR
jgi:hypothetical protein